MSQVRRRLPEVEVIESFLERTSPSVEAVMASVRGRSVIVPLMLTTGQAHHGLPWAARRSRFRVTLTRPLGPHPLLAAAMCLRLRAAGARLGDPVLMVAAGSPDTDALVETAMAGRMLQSRGGAMVRVAHLSGAGNRVPEVVEEMRCAGAERIAMAPYLLAPDHLHTMARLQALAQAVKTSAGVLAEHPLVAELVVRRYRAATGAVAARDAA